MKKQEKLIAGLKYIGYRLLSYISSKEKRKLYRNMARYIKYSIFSEKPKGWNELCAAVASQKYERNGFILLDNIFNKDAELVDNYFLFEYLQEQKEWKDKSYYLMNVNSPQLQEATLKYGNHIIEYKHGEFSQQLVNALHSTKYWLDSFQAINRMGIRDIIFSSDIITVYTQHGINFFKPGFLGDKWIGNSVFKKIIFSNTSERDLFKKYYSYHDNDTILAGLSRWDAMKEQTEKTIFLYFTSRAYLPSLRNKENSDYLINIKNLLKNSELKSLVCQHGLKIYVAIHHTIRKYINLDTDFVEFIEDKDIGRIKQTAAMLVTDFSSMCFDFMYKDRPVVFYRVDAFSEDLARHKDAEVNNINVEDKNNELYNIYYNNTDIVKRIRYYIENNFKLEDKYKNINDKFFCNRVNIRKTIIEKLTLEHSTVFNQEGYKRGNDYFPQINLPFYHDFTEETQFCVSGLSNRDKTGRHTDGKNIYFNFSVPTAEHLLLNLVFQPVFPITEIKIKVNNYQIAHLLFKNTNDASSSIIINKSLFSDGKLNIELSLPYASPVGHDTRELSLHLKKLTLESCSECVSTYSLMKHKTNREASSMFYRAFFYQLLSHLPLGASKNAYQAKKKHLKSKLAQGTKEKFYFFGIALLSKVSLDHWNCYYFFNIPFMTIHYSIDKTTTRLFNIEIYKKKRSLNHRITPTQKTISLTDLSNKEKQIYETLKQIQNSKRDFDQIVLNVKKALDTSNPEVLLRASAEKILDSPHDNKQLMALSKKLARSFFTSDRNIYIDITTLNTFDAATGIQRVAKNILFNSMLKKIKNIQISPIYFDKTLYRHAGDYIRKNINSNHSESNYIINFYHGDILLLPEILRHDCSSNTFKNIMNKGVLIYGIQHDIIPIKFPQYCSDEIIQKFGRYLEIFSSLNGIIAVSKSTADDYREWRKANIPDSGKPFLIDWFHLGADLDKGIGTTGIPADSAVVFEAMDTRPSLLEVSTVEPRKGHRQTLDAFELLWAKGIDANFVIVGKPGWKMDDFFTRIESHPEFGKRLFWLKGISDEYLNKVYDVASGVIMPSEAEGFGLAIIEGAHHGKPLILRDIPVFREIAGDHATYFSGLEPAPLAECIEQWLDNFKQGTVIPSTGIKPLTWAESTQMLLSKLPL